jgi:very-short-patch-repair endonuclease
MKNESLGQRFARIREHYKRELPRMMAIHEETGRCHFDPYRLDFASDMTPIEYSVWCDIRGTCLPFYPQIPALNYFLDFADPFKKIAIECDGAQWHDAEKDAKRDARLKEMGWTIYRIPGRVCKKLITPPLDLLHDKREQDYSMEEAIRMVMPHARDWYANTSEGIVKAIGIVHYGHTCPFVDAGMYVHPIAS